jgi:hypothetical protein
MNREGYGRKRLWPNLKNCPGIFLEGLRKTIKILSGYATSLQAGT